MKSVARDESETDYQLGLDAGWAPAARRRLSPSRRGYDAAWAALSAEHLSAHPTCARCGAPAEEVHHSIPFKRWPDVRLCWGPLVSLCKVCHADVEESVRNGWESFSTANIAALVSDRWDWEAIGMVGEHFPWPVDTTPHVPGGHT